MQSAEHTPQRQFGLALSGGGFRASLYHLGVIRFLRDAGILPRVTTITSVSGGSIISAHLALNWDRYCGTKEEFDGAASELLKLVRMDVRNRIVRRFPLAAGVNVLRRVALLGAARRYTRTGLLERHYEDFLYGDRGLLELPEKPRLYILATNLSHGSLCAFCRDGLLFRRRGAGNRIEVDTLSIGLATVAMAVTASSAFPGFFPPLELSHKDVGASQGEFDRQAFTDGGIYDNLGLRMFRFLGSVRGAGSATRDAPGERLDGIFVSDAGATFKVTTSSAGGLLKTALRSSDILMDRVNQLELEAFAETGGVVFLPITRIVGPDEDAAALHPEIQRHAAWIRTDLDRFSDLEISALAQHGYCVTRRILREIPEGLFDELPEGPPWNPVPEGRAGAELSAGKLSDPAAALRAARRLQRSSGRRVLTSLLSLRDWPTYVWLPLLAVVVLGVPYLLYDAHRTAIQQQQVLSAVAQSSPLYADVLEELARSGPEPIGELQFEKIDSVEPLDFTGYDVISDDRIYDLRGWTSSKRPRFPARMHARFRILRTEQAAARPTLRIQLPSEQDTMHADYLPASLNPTHRRALSDGLYTFETTLDFGRVPLLSETTLIVRQDIPAHMASQEFGIGQFRFTVAARTGLVRIWILLPRGRPHGEFDLYRSPISQPEVMEIVHATTSVEVPGGSIATFQMVNPPEGYRYACRWRWLDDEATSAEALDR